MKHLFMGSCQRKKDAYPKDTIQVETEEALARSQSTGF